MRFLGGTVLGPDGLQSAPLAVRGGVLADHSEGPVVDVSGLHVLPGIIDLHGDGFERHIAPRRGAFPDPSVGLRALDAELGAAGITTAYLAQFASWEGGMRGPEAAWRLAQALDSHRGQMISDMRMQLRIETHLTEIFDEMLDLVATHDVGYVVYNDHLPHKELQAGKSPPRFIGQALKAGRNPEVHRKMMERLELESDRVPAQLKTLSAKLIARGVTLGSHDDPTPDVRARFAAMGAEIAEFPLSLEAAMGSVVMGAPNVLRQGSHKGFVSAEDVVAAGQCDALVSDYVYQALPAAIFAMVTRGVLPLEAGWALVSTGPARLLRLSDRGVLTPGLRADMVFVDLAAGRITATLAAGQFSHLSGTMAERVLLARPET